MIARVSHFYGMSWGGVMRLPVRAFWLYSNSVDRLQAADDLRALRIAICAEAPDAQEGLIRELNELRGTVVKQAATTGRSEADKARAREGIETLRSLQFLGG